MTHQREWLIWWLSAFEPNVVKTQAQLKRSLKGLTLEEQPEHRREGYQAFRKMNWKARTKLMKAIIKNDLNHLY
jgi:hypothetical protein